jgi:glycerol uptake facilitator-like aquaporin
MACESNDSLAAELDDESADNMQRWPLRPKGIVSSIKEETPSFWVRLAQLSPYVAEFMGCLLQALAWNCTELGKESTKAGEWKPLVVGLTLMMSTYSFAAVSGAHLNPAVSVAVGLSDFGDWIKLTKYIAAQFLGSAAGVALSCLTYRKNALEAIGPRNGYHDGTCVAVEVIYTATLCLVYLNVTLSRSNNSVKAGNQFYALAIGFAMAAGCWASEDISGAIFNPGLALAVDFQNVRNGVGHGFTYIVAELLGAFFASIAYRVIRPSEDVEDHELWATSQVSKHDVITNAKLAAEGAGTWITVFTFGMTTLSKTYTNERPFAAAAALISMHYALADVSGGHFNPAVTFSVMLNGRGKCSTKQGMAFMAVQIVSASVAGLFYMAIRYPKSFEAIPEASETKYGRLPMSMVDMIYAFVVCYTALATFTIVGIKANLKRNYFDGLAYGLSSAVGGFAMLHLLNSLANPALTLGEALAHTIYGGSSAGALYISFFQMVGAVLASCLFRFTHAADFRRHHALMGEDAPLVDAVGKRAFEGIGAADARLRLIARDVLKEDVDEPDRL